MERENPTAEAPVREELTERVLRIEGQLNGLLARVIGRAAVMRLMGAEPVLEGVLWLPIAERVDRRGVVYYLAAVLKDGVGYEVETGREVRRKYLMFDVTYAPDGDPDQADTTRWPGVQEAIADYHRIGPSWIPEG